MGLSSVDGEIPFRDVSMHGEDVDILMAPEAEAESGEVEVDTVDATISYDTTQNVDVLLDTSEDQPPHMEENAAVEGDNAADKPVSDNGLSVAEASDNDKSEEDEDEDHVRSSASQLDPVKVANQYDPDSRITTEESRKAPSTLACDQGPYARTLEFFLATISRLEAENSTLKKRLETATDNVIASKTTHEPSLRDQSVDGDRHAPIVYETLHLVYHDKDTRRYYRDVPRKFKGDSVSDRNCSTAKDHLRGLNEIENGSTYLERNPHIAFFVSHQYVCQDFMADDNYSMSGRKGDRLIRDTRPGKSENQNILCGYALSKALKTIITKHPARFKDIKVKVPGWIMKPYLLFYWHIKTFQELCSKSDLDEDQRARVTLLCDWLEENYRKDWDEADELMSRGKISTKHHDKLFRPGDIVIEKNSDPHAQFTTMKVQPYPWNDQTENKADLYRWDFNGSFCKIKYTYLIKNWPPNSDVDEETDITSLEIYPIRFASQDLFPQLVARGEKFWKYRAKTVASYRDPEIPQQQTQSVGRYIVDYATFRRIHPKNEIFLNSPETPQPSDSPDEDFFAILPAKILAFSFLTKEWKWLHVEFLTDVTWNKDAFKRLVVPEDTKDMIKGLIRAQNNLSGAPLDIIGGKGKGLLMLLHGPPGTGKTLTAESIAECEERPLYRVTGGDVGLTPIAVERYLGKVFELGKAWGCVVLLDEADVFIEARGFERLERNALISVFLRVLEYYDGILILTTNRVGTFDEAFKSRIQLALSYPKLDRDQRRQIWQNFFNMMREYRDRINIQDLELNIEELADVEINGRQIRNALTTARHLADFKKERLVYGHLKLTIGKIQKFDEYLKEVQYDNVGGGYLDDEAVARELKLR